jgi:hypothetical protein
MRALRERMFNKFVSRSKSLAKRKKPVIREARRVEARPPVMKQKKPKKKKRK